MTGAAVILGGVEVERTDESAIVLRHSGVGAGGQQWYLLTADWHWDNPHCNRGLLKRHLDQAKERNAGIFVFGDLFCAMQGKYDPRHVKGEIRPEHQGGNYLDLLIETAVDWLEPYRANIVGIGDGNHEWAIEQRLETSLIGRLTERLQVQRLWEWGFVGFLFEHGQSKGRRSRRTLYYHHGSGGGGPVTRGVIAAARRDGYIQDADLIATGHVHEAWGLEAPFVRMTLQGKVERRERVHLQLGTYKDEFVRSGYHVRNQRPPKPLGGFWVRFSNDNRAPGCVRMDWSRTD